MPAFWNERDDAPGDDRHYPAGQINGRWLRGFDIPTEKRVPDRRTSMLADAIRAMTDVRTEA
jgi:hypothetical protein